MPSLQSELKKRGPFASVQQEATLAIMRTSDLLENRMARLLRDHGLTLSQYNVLRILRGEGEPLPCLEVANRMIQVAPAITRVVDQLVKLDLILKVQSSADRRVYLIEPTRAGLKVLQELDEPVMEMHSNLLGGVSVSDQRVLIRLLEQLRSAVPA